MTKKLQHWFALSEKGAKDLVKAVLWCFVCNLSLMLPVGAVMFTVQHLLDVLARNFEGAVGIVVSRIDTGGIFCRPIALERFRTTIGLFALLNRLPHLLCILYPYPEPIRARSHALGAAAGIGKIHQHIPAAFQRSRRTAGLLERREDPAILARVATLQILEELGKQDNRPGTVGTAGEQVAGERARTALDERGDHVARTPSIVPGANGLDRKTAVPRARHRPTSGCRPLRAG